MRLCLPPNVLRFFFSIWQVCFFMKKKVSFLSINVGQSRSGFLFYVCWFLGILFGVSLFSLYREKILPLMCSAVLSPVSIVALVVSLFFPLLISFIFVVFRCPFLFCVFALGKGFALGFILSCLCNWFADAYYLVAVLFLFSDICMLWPTLCIWSFGWKTGTLIGHKCVVQYFLIALSVGLVDYLFISPLLIRVFGLN